MSDEDATQAVPLDTSATEPHSLLLLQPGGYDSIAVSDLATELDRVGFPAHIYSKRCPTERLLDSDGITLALVLLSTGLNVLEGAAGNATWAAIKLAVGKYLSRRPAPEDGFTVVVRSNQSTGQMSVKVEGNAQAVEDFISGVPLGDVLKELKR